LRTSFLKGDLSQASKAIAESLLLLSKNQRNSPEYLSVLMGEFYTQLKEPNITKAKAIRNAQVSLLKDPLYEHPYYWAPFVLVGNWL